MHIYIHIYKPLKWIQCNQETYIACYMFEQYLIQQNDEVLYEDVLKYLFYVCLYIHVLNILL